MTLPVEELKQILSVAAKYKKNGTSPKAADLVGINMEGPFISKVKKGAQDERNIIPCNVEIAEQFLEAADGLEMCIRDRVKEQLLKWTID